MLKPDLELLSKLYPGAYFGRVGQFLNIFMHYSFLNYKVIDDPNMENYDNMEKFQDSLVDTYGEDNIERIDELFYVGDKPVSEADPECYPITRRLGIMNAKGEVIAPCFVTAMIGKEAF